MASTAGCLLRLLRAQLVLVEYGGSFTNAPQQETFTSTLELFGDPNRFSGMALAVGVTCGIATQLLLDGHPALSTHGVLAPYHKDICDPIRELVEKEGVVMVEEVVKNAA